MARPVAIPRSEIDDPDARNGSACQTQTMELRDGDFTLRPPIETDAPLIAAAVKQSLAELKPWMAWAHEGYDERAAGQWVRGEFGEEHRFVMINGAGDLVGSCGLNHIDRVNLWANLGYWVRSDRTGRGYASRAAALLARYGLDEAGYERLEILIATGNEPSRRVAEHIGARYEGRARRRLLVHGSYHDAYVYSVVRTDLG